jgi:hypothetical protein
MSIAFWSERRMKERPPAERRGRVHACTWRLAAASRRLRFAPNSIVTVLAPSTHRHSVGNDGNKTTSILRETVITRPRRRPGLHAPLWMSETIPRDIITQLISNRTSINRPAHDPSVAGPCPVRPFPARLARAIRLDSLSDWFGQRTSGFPTTPLQHRAPCRRRRLPSPGRGSGCLR